MPIYANPFQGEPFLSWLNQRGGWNDMLEPGDGDPRAGFSLLTRWLRQPGSTYAPQTVQNWTERQYDRWLSDYAAAAAFDPTLRWFDYLASRNLGQEYGNASRYERGEQSPAVYAPRMRFLGG